MKRPVLELSGYPRSVCGADRGITKAVSEKRNRCKFTTQTDFFLIMQMRITRRRRGSTRLKDKPAGQTEI